MACLHGILNDKIFFIAEYQNRKERISTLIIKVAETSSQSQPLMFKPGFEGPVAKKFLNGI